MSIDFRGFPTSDEKEWLSDEDHKFIGFEPKIIIEHIFSEIKKAQQQNLTEDDAYLLNSINNQAHYCKNNLEDNNSKILPYTFFWLGRLTQELESGFYGEKRIEFYKAMMKANTTNFNTDFENTIKREVKELVQTFATNHWELNPNDRIGEVSQIIWAKTHEFFIYARKQEDWGEHSYFWEKKEKSMPDKPDGIKPWLREIAPKNAQRRGRPRKI